MKMKTLTLLLALTVTSLVSFAQKTPFFQAGIKGGVNITKVEGKSFKDEFRFGYGLGGFATIRLSEKFQLQPEVLFNQYTSSSATNFDTLTNVSNLKDIRLNYLNIPILLNFTPTRFVTFQAGPQFAVLLNKDDNLWRNGKRAFKDGDFSLVGGIQFNLANFKIGGRYFVGLNDIGDIDNRESWKNQGFQLSLGLRIL